MPRPVLLGWMCMDPISGQRDRCRGGWSHSARFAKWKVAAVSFAAANPAECGQSAMLHPVTTENSRTMLRSLPDRM